MQFAILPFHVKKQARYTGNGSDSNALYPSSMVDCWHSCLHAVIMLSCCHNGILACSLELFNPLTQDVPTGTTIFSITSCNHIQKAHLLSIILLLDLHKPD